MTPYEDRLAKTTVSFIHGAEYRLMVDEHNETIVIYNINDGAITPVCTIHGVMNARIMAAAFSMAADELETVLSKKSNE